MSSTTVARSARTTRARAAAPVLEVTPELWALMTPELQARLVARDPEYFMGMFVGANAPSAKPATRKSTRKGAPKAEPVAEVVDESAERWASIAAHVHERRIARRESTKLGGLTKAERREIASAHRDELNAALKKSRAAYDRKWAALVKAHKSA